MIQKLYRYCTSESCDKKDGRAQTGVVRVGGHDQTILFALLEANL
jgi:hypothetical protein